METHRQLKIDDVPTIELHRHFEAGMSPETIAALAQKNGVTKVRTRTTNQVIENVDPQDPESIRNYYQRIKDGFDGPQGFADFLDSLGLPLSVMRTLEDLDATACQQITDQAARGSLHTEIRGTPCTYQKYVKSASLEDIILAIQNGIDRAYAEHAASGAYIACFSRQREETEAGRIVQAVMATSNRETPIGIDIAGMPENKFPPSRFKSVLKPAREAGIPITVHAGEQGKPPLFADAPASYVKDAVLELGARRIGHGTSLVSDEAVRQLMIDMGIGIECAPVSNEMMGFIGINQHPLKSFLDAGLLASASTDDPLMFGVSSVREMLVKFGADLNIDPLDVIEMTRNGIKTAFVSEARRSKLNDVFAKKIEDLTVVLVVGAHI